MFLAAQISIYPLRQPTLSPVINRALNVFQSYGLEVTTGAMSSLVSGNDEMLFSAIKEAFKKTAEQGEVVMTIILSNACPISR
jgi:uncharacterized protein YqgV (UPF0045/DUF77 family)